MQSVRRLQFTLIIFFLDIFSSHPIIGLFEFLQKKLWNEIFNMIYLLRVPKNYFVFGLDQLCPTQMAYWAKNYVIVLTRAAHWMT